MGKIESEVLSQMRFETSRGEFERTKSDGSEVTRLLGVIIA